VLRITELNTENFSPKLWIDEEFDDIVEINDDCPNPETAWRFCWTSEETEDNPKMCPCFCTGSMKYIHFLCLKQWTDSRKQLTEEQGVHSIIWKNFDCEIWKRQYPYVFDFKGRKWNLHDPYRPNDNYNTPYIILESLKNDRNSARVVHTLTATDKKSDYKLGRGHEADVRVINDISVSRLHMSLKFINGNFVLNDWKSKFGTLVLIRNDLPINWGEHKAIQVGRTIMNFELKNNGSWCFDEPFKDPCASSLFENILKSDLNVPNFGVEEEKEDVNLPEQDRIQNLVPHFTVHPNTSVMKGQLLPPNQYQIDPNSML
jgi:hypothetical protein